MSSKSPLPRHFTDFDSYASAFLAFSVSALPAVTDYDSHAEATAKRKAIAAVAEEANETAWENWSVWMDVCADRHERGIGAGWA